MALLRPVEERDTKGNTIRINTSITFQACETIRRIIGRHDWREEPNPEYHPPLTAQVQDSGDGKPQVKFFWGTPDTTLSRAGAKECSREEVPAYIVKQLEAHPIKVRIPVPTVYEVRIAQLGDVPVTQLQTLTPDAAGNVHVTAVEPNIDPAQLQGGRKSMRTVDDEGTSLAAE